jgi:predicted nuclease of restriction endonuclease-like (RecB) superfamily
MPRKTTRSITLKRKLDFTRLVDTVRQVCERSVAVASRAVNVSLTLRNWLVGFYIVEYEQHGADRAQYGERLLEKLADALADKGTAEMSARSLRLYRQFFLTYPGIWQSAIAKTKDSPLPGPIWRSLIAESDKSRLFRESPTPKSKAFQQPGADEHTLITRLSFTHLAELIAVNDPLKRAFYEIESIRGNWSVRSLKRQIASLYFERSGLSRDKEKLAALVRAGAEQAEPNLAIRDPYVFEFLGIKSKEVMSESRLEDALLDKLQEFLLELGHGFCFEARQKSVLIGKTRGFVDLVFYHRILKCHVLVELKVDEFRHEHIGQLNTYVTWFRKHMMLEGDNPPVGLLLCTQKDRALVEYALAAMNNRLFVSKYQLVLPSKEDLRRFLEQQRRELVDE